MSVTHSALSESLLRPPGVPPSGCPGELIDVDCEGKPVKRPKTYRDAAQGNEGEAGETVAIRLRKCSKCRRTIVTAKCADGETRQRNEWTKEAAIA